MNNPVLVGNRKRLWCRFLDDDGVAKTPTTVALKVQPPTGDQLTVATTPAAADGEVFADIIFDQPGVWKYRFEGAGDFIAACDGWVNVKGSALA